MSNRNRTKRADLEDRLLTLAIGLVAFALLGLMMWAQSCAGQVYTNAAPSTRTQMIVFTNRVQSYQVSGANAASSSLIVSTNGVYTYNAALSGGGTLDYTNIQSGVVFQLTYRDPFWSRYGPQVWNLGALGPDTNLLDWYVASNGLGGPWVTNWQASPWGTNSGVSVTALSWNTITNYGYYATNAPTMNTNLNYGF